MTRRDAVLWALVKVLGVACHLALVLLLILSIFRWTDFGLWAFLDSRVGTHALAGFHIVLGAAYRKTAGGHARSRAFEVSGAGFIVVGIVIAAWAAFHLLMGQPGEPGFRSGGGRLVLFVATMAPIVIGGFLNRPQGS